MTPSFEAYCGHPDGEADDVWIEYDAFTSCFDEIWRTITLTGSPREADWFALADAIDQVPDNQPCITIINSMGGSVRGITRLATAIQDATSRGCWLASFVDRKSFGGSFAAALEFPLFFMRPDARCGGLQGDELSVLEAAERIRRRLAERDEEFECVLSRSRLMERLRAGHRMNGEESELNHLCHLAVSAENTVVPIVSQTEDWSSDHD